MSFINGNTVKNFFLVKKIEFRDLTVYEYLEKKIWSILVHNDKKNKDKVNYTFDTQLSLNILNIVIHNCFSHF